MLFARLVAVVLSLGSVATVLAAPIDVSNVRVGIAVDSSKIQRRALLAFPNTLMDTTDTFKSFKDKISTLVSAPSVDTSEIAVVMNQVASATGPLMEAFNAAGLSKDELLTLADGTAKAPDALVNDMSAFLQTVSGIFELLKNTSAVTLTGEYLTTMGQRLKRLQSIQTIVPETAVGSLKKDFADAVGIVTVATNHKL